jgi:hypothetical protein
MDRAHAGSSIDPVVLGPERDGPPPKRQAAMALRVADGEGATATTTGNEPREEDSV